MSTREERRMAKYNSLDERSLQKRDLKNRRNGQREVWSLNSSSATTMAVPNPYHAANSGYHGYQAYKYSGKADQSAEALKTRGSSQQEYTFGDRMEDAYKGTRNGFTGQQMLGHAKRSVWESIKKAFE
ncbi:hypothetical protein ABW20_dc0108469 [Dactylellina cionopaga]|nr:hypothetical protein ABW20_dc0108469 [Dactylellina cionopaga]